MKRSRLHKQIVARQRELGMTTNALATQVAELAQVHPSTVRRYLDDSSSDTSTRVLEHLLGFLDMEVVASAQA
tara:strand:+ start:131 stop:349 length:219 start_codon:yes stop_codon:yes gene_type:complete